MKLPKVPASIYKKYFLILFCVTVGVFSVNFIANLMGYPVSELTIDGNVIVPKTFGDCLLHAGIGAAFVGTVLNFFVTTRFIKERLCLVHWPAAAVVVMTILFPLELLLAAVLLLPNMIVFGVRSLKKDPVYDVQF